LAHADLTYNLDPLEQVIEPDALILTHDVLDESSN
jgi:hypothetical protein